MKLTASFIKTAPDGLYSDDSTTGLFLRVRGSARSWYLRRKISGKRYEIGLGSAAGLPLAAARAKALKLMVMTPDEFVASREKKQEEKAQEEIRRTFRQVVDEFMAWNVQVGNWEMLNKSHRVFECRMRLHVLPKLGPKFIDEIQPSDLADVAADIWDQPYLFSRCIQLTKRVFDWAKAKGYARGDNPADKQGALQFLLPRTKHIPTNRGALAVKDLPRFFAASLACKQTPSRQCFEFSILTATRSKTAREARWEQIDWQEGLWSIPPEQLKIAANGALVVPLAPEVLEFLAGIDREREGLIFPNHQGDVMSDTMVSRMVALTPGDWVDEAESLKRGEPVRATQHGIARATFRTWAQDDSLGNDRRFDARTAELCLHHKVRDSFNGAYERNQSLLRRREMMEAWAKFCYSLAKD